MTVAEFLKLWALCLICALIGLHFAPAELPTPADLQPQTAVARQTPDPEAACEMWVSWIDTASPEPLQWTYHYAVIGSSEWDWCAQPGSDRPEAF